jgi:hypothetical protein
MIVKGDLPLKPSILRRIPASITSNPVCRNYSPYGALCRSSVLMGLCDDQRCAGKVVVLSLQLVLWKKKKIIVSVRNLLLHVCHDSISIGR